jgi:hypothetical protein
MELSAIINERNLPLTRHESDLVTRLSSGISAASGELYDQRMKTLAAAREVLEQLPDRKTMARQDSMEKAGMLKERLKLLHQLLQFMSPASVKSLKAEMKQIASQLSSLSDETVGGNAGAIFAAAATVDELPKPGSNAETAPGAAEVNEAGPENGGTPQEHVLSGSAAQSDGSKSGNGTAEDRQLKETVEELKSLYRAVLAAMKRKQQSGRGSGQLSGHAAHLRVYADVPDSEGSVAIKV